ncbi:MAG TPA: hypothetical protein VK524_33250 [Polyangiaceae bacterium]|nr:hypothetical protein [Polyangiaceae bacterium]
MSHRLVAALFTALIASACTLEQTEPAASFEDCEFGSLTGSWRIEYQQQSGNCGQVPTQTGLLDEESLATGCQIDSSNVSPDRCQLDMVARCPTSDQLGTQTWQLRMRHVATDELNGTGTLQINYVTGACQSAYAIKATKK